MARLRIPTHIRTHAEGWMSVVRPSPTREGCFRATTMKEGEASLSEDYPTVRRAMAAADADVRLRGHTCTADCSSW